MNLRIMTKYNAADPEIGFLTKSILKPYGRATAMPTAWELKRPNCLIFLDTFKKSSLISRLSEGFLSPCLERAYFSPCISRVAQQVHLAQAQIFPQRFQEQHLNPINSKNLTKSSNRNCFNWKHPNFKCFARFKNLMRF